MAYTVFNHDTTLSQWTKDVMDDPSNTIYTIHDPEPNAITLMTGGPNSEEMIRIDETGFYVRGVRVPADQHEAETVYNAFKQWLAWANLQQQRK